MTPYVSFAEAKTSPRTVQVMGALEKGTSRYDTSTKTLHFTLVDPKTKESIPVSYTDVKPANFEDAVSIVAIGRYDKGRLRRREAPREVPLEVPGRGDREAVRRKKA